MDEIEITQEVHDGMFITKFTWPEQWPEQWQEVKIDELALRRYFMQLVWGGEADPWQEDEFMQRTDHSWPTRDGVAIEEDG